MKCYHFKRGVNGLNAVHDRAVGIGQMVMPGTSRESLHILDALLKLDAEGKPETVATDDALYRGLVVELFTMLGHDFSPSGRSAWSLMPPCSGRPAASTPPSAIGGFCRPSCGSMTCWTRTWPGSPR
ncbi:Tn3 family transposase [Streptomyces sp. NRRL S-646]|uniref:Tn3 family transposase n=1 Tax=Streptomyces sp. NRRL S-646 TaxID=1463917 RepID=UPI00099C08FE